MVKSSISALSHRTGGPGLQLPKQTEEGRNEEQNAEDVEISKPRPRKNSNRNRNAILIILCISCGSLLVVAYVSHRILHNPWPIMQCPEDFNATLDKSDRVIASLVMNRPEDLKQLCRGLKSLRFLADMADESLCIPPADVLIFHDADPETGRLSLSHQKFLRSCLEGRQLSFSAVHMDQFPPNFNPDEEQPNFTKRSKWGYQQMIRFWITSIWNQPAIQSYKTVMRLDSDACYKLRLYKANKRNGDGPNHWMVPGLPNTTDSLVDSTSLTMQDAVAVYHAGEQQLDDHSLSDGFGTFVYSYVEKHNLTVRNPKLFSQIIPNSEAKVPLFYNNFEVSQVAFMQRPEVRAFHEALTEQEPFGVFRKRWGDAIERFATMAIFAYPHQIVLRPPYGYEHRCK